MKISDQEMAALHNLAEKRAGKDVDWINIADARSLTGLGLARRNREGWEITDEGLALVKTWLGGPTLTSVPNCGVDPVAAPDDGGSSAPQT